LNDRPSGAKQRFYGIYGELIKQLPDAEFVIFEPNDCNVGAWFNGAKNVAIRRTPIPSQGRLGKFLGGLNYWSTALIQEKFDLFECFNQPLVKAPTGLTLSTIHDIRRVYSDWGILERTAYRATLRKTLSTVDHVITVSESIKREILDFAAVSSISVTYNGLDVHKYEAVEDTALQAFRSKFRLSENFILAVGHIEKRKNYLTLIAAMAHLHAQGRVCHLLIIGNDSGERAVLEERIKSSKLSGHVKFLNGLSDIEVRCAYKLCSLFVFPSTYEGFGIPILEAMAAGRPMVLSDIPVFREITEDNSVYFLPTEAENMATAIEMVLTSNSERARLIEYGTSRVKAFSFEVLATQIKHLYRSLT